MPLLRQISLDGHAKDVQNFIAGENVTFATQSDGTIQINASGGDPGGCVTYSLDIDGSDLVLRDSDSAVVQRLPLPVGWGTSLRLEDGTSYFEIDVSVPSVSMSEDVRNAFNAALIGGLPSGYTRAAITSASKNAYVDTGLTLNGAYEIEFKGHTMAQGAAVLFDSYTSNDLRMGGIMYNRADPRYDCYWPGVGNGRLETAGLIDLSQTFTLVQNKNGATITQGSNTATRSYAGTEATDTTPILVAGGTQRTTSPDSTTTEEIIIRDSIGGTMLRHYIGCTRDSDSVAGLYDLVTNTFKPSDGTAQFTA